MTIPYVCGFMSDQNLQRVLLIKKAYPSWMAGKLNGIGGHVEEKEDESIYEAMIREFKEETSIDSDKSDWKFIFDLVVNDGLANVSFFHWCNPHFEEDLKRSRSRSKHEDEPLEVCYVNDIPINIVKGLNWIIPMCLDPNITRSSILTNSSTVFYIQKEAL